ncbi:MAG: hypothetical protein V3S89_12315 [Desulfobacterales bacterium]
MSEPTRFKVTLEFEVDVKPISVPDVDTFSKLRHPGAKGKEKPKLSEKELRALMKKKGMSDADIDKYMAGDGKGKGDAASKAKAKGKGQDYQLLLYPEYEKWAAAQRALQDEILKDETLSTRYVQDMLRDLIRGRLDAILDDKYGAPDINTVLEQAIQRLSAAEQETLKVEVDSMLFDETELVDDSVDCRFAGLTVTET